MTPGTSRKMHDNVVRERETLLSKLPVLKAHKQTGRSEAHRRAGGHDTAASSGLSSADHEISTTIRLGASNASDGGPSRVTRVLGTAAQVVASSGH